MQTKERERDQHRARRPSASEPYRLAGPKPGYAPADAQGNFEPMTECPSDSRRASFEALGEVDASERSPGGPIAEAVFAAGPAAQRLLWLAPLGSFLAARLFQCVGLLAATHRYVYSVSHAEGWPEGGPLLAAEEDLYGPIRFAAFGLRDNFASSLGREEEEMASWPGLAVEVLAATVPLLWLAVVLFCCNLRIWARTLAVGSILALLKGFSAWMTLIPEPLGWMACRERLHPWALAHFQGETQLLRSVPLVLWLWLQDLFFGVKGQDSLVCAGSFVGPSYLCVLFSIGLYDALRAMTRRFRFWPRLACRGLAALLLAVLAITCAWRELVEGRQYSVGIVLALVLPLLLYSSPEVALGTDLFLRWASGAKAEGGLDMGDVLVPPCCVPFCCVSGRYFLYPRPDGEVEELLRVRAEAAKTLETLRLDQEDGAWRLLELEAQLEYVRQRTQVRERQETMEAERSLGEQLLAQQKAHERSLAAKLSELEAGKASQHQQPLGSSRPAQKCRGELTPFPDREAVEPSSSSHSFTAPPGVDASPLPGGGRCLENGDFRSAPSIWSSCHARFPSRRELATARPEELCSGTSG